MTEHDPKNTTYCTELLQREWLMAEKAVEELKDTSKEILEQLGDMEIFRRENQVLILFLFLNKNQ